MENCDLLVDLSDPADSCPVVPQPPARPASSCGGRRSFYALPRSLDAEDDPFGLLARNNNSSLFEGGKSLIQMEEVHTGSLIQIESSGSSTSGSCSSGNEPGPTLSQLLASSSSARQQLAASGSSVSSGASGLFGNMSAISHLNTPGGTRSLLDDVFTPGDSLATSSVGSSLPDWERIQNEAQVVALTLSLDQPSKTPVQKVASSALLGPYSPCEALESPLMDITKEEEFLVSLTPDRSPVRQLIDMSNRLNTPDMIETTERLSRVLKDINIEGETDETQPTRKVTPKAKLHRKSVAPLVGSGLRPIHEAGVKENIVPRSSRPLSSKPKLSLRVGPPVEPMQPALNSEAVEKPQGNKVQKSNVRRTSMTRPAAAAVDLSLAPPLASMPALKDSLAAASRLAGRTVAAATTTRSQSVATPLTARGRTPLVRASDSSVINSKAATTGKKPESRPTPQLRSLSRGPVARVPATSSMLAPRLNCTPARGTAYPSTGPVRGLLPPSSTGTVSGNGSARRSVLVSSTPVRASESMQPPAGGSASQAYRPPLQRQGSGLARPVLHAATCAAPSRRLIMPPVRPEGQQLSTPIVRRPAADMLLPAVAPSSVHSAAAEGLQLMPSGLATPKSKLARPTYTLPSPKVGAAKSGALVFSTPSEQRSMRTALSSPVVKRRAT